MRYLNLLIVLFVVLHGFYANAQCRVTHLSGTQIVNGTSITVTQTGAVDTLTYCSETLGPYLVGIHSYPWPFACSTGSYTFTFLPPVNEAYLNFGGINGDVNEEQIRLFVNNIHYSIPNKGDTNKCYPQLAILTANGDIASPNWDVSGWNNTKISGNISSLTVQDTVIAGCGNGVTFSLSLCKWPDGVNDETKVEELITIYPNPSNGLIHFHNKKMLCASLSISNLMGECVYQKLFKANEEFSSINLSHLEDGIYTYAIKFENGRKQFGKLNLLH